jgi:hypothetical protein
MKLEELTPEDRERWERYIVTGLQDRPHRLEIERGDHRRRADEVTEQHRHDAARAGHGWAGSGDPQARQNRACSGLRSPQFVQTTICA